MDEILKILKSIKIPLSQKRPNMSGVRYRGKDNRLYGNSIRSVSMGLVRDWKTGGKTISNFTQKYPELWNLLVKYGDSNVPHPYTSVCINLITILIIQVYQVSLVSGIILVGNLLWSIKQ